MFKEIDVPLLFRLWEDDEKTVQDVARELGVTRSTVYKISRRYGLPRKETSQKAVDRDKAAWLPTPQEIEERAAEVRSRWTPEREYQARCRW